MKLLYASLVIIFFSCKNNVNIPDDFDYGKIENNVYVNKYFNFEMPVPGTWAIQTKEQVEQLREKGREVIAEKNKEMAEKLKANDIKSAILLTAYKNKTDSVLQEYNHGFSVVVENLGSRSGVNSGSQYLSYVRKLMKEASVGYKAVTDLHSETLGNKKFDVMENIIHVKGLDITQKYYATIERDFALVILLSFIGEEQKRELISVVDKVKFN